LGKTPLLDWARKEKTIKEEINMKQFYPEVHKKLGFGCMRLPMSNEEVDTAQMKKMVDMFLERGFNYFDTAHGYVGGKSETALKECLTSRYPRERYILTDKLSTHHFNKEEEIRPLFESQLEACGVDYFDFYLMHAQDENIFAKFERCNAYKVAYGFKAEGKIRHFGISFHDRAEVLEKILKAHPEIEVVQIQFNYVDYEDPSVESRKVYEVCEKYGKPVIVMEPIKGGSLLNLPDEAQKLYDELGGGSNASYAIRFAAGFDNIMMVLSGMSNVENMEDNTSYMQEFQPLDRREIEAVEKVVEIFRAQNLIPCTACRYCMEECPKGISIPDLFALMNAKKRFGNWNTDYYYNNIHTGEGRKASDCLRCGKCERICPQHLNIRELLENVAAEFEA
jgi:predicted aldo/keto reductase-like oxidoreductase